jgi:hypothetical protein
LVTQENASLREDTDDQDASQNWLWSRTSRVR